VTWDRGGATLVASWEAYARAAEGAAVVRRPGVAAAVFPAGPDRAIYNNALLGRDLPGEARRAALVAMEEAYGAAGVDRFAAWVYESDAPMIAELEARGYRLDATTRAMAMSLAALDIAMPAIDVDVPAWDEYQRHLESFGVPPGLLANTDGSEFDLLVVRGDDGEAVATALAFDHEDDCGIYNVGTLEAHRRRGLGTALTAVQLHRAKRRGCTTASLQSTAIAAGVYASVGFENLGRILEYVPRGAKGCLAPRTGSAAGPAGA
jgi:ribosomal protein S18 acetylase RimI-like enzyme